MAPSCSCMPPKLSVSLRAHLPQNWAPQSPLHVCPPVAPFSHPCILPDTKRWDILSSGEEGRVVVCVKNPSEPASTWTSGSGWHMDEFPSQVGGHGHIPLTMGTLAHDLSVAKGRPWHTCTPSASGHCYTASSSRSSCGGFGCTSPYLFLCLRPNQLTPPSHPGPVHAVHSHHLEEETQWGRGVPNDFCSLISHAFKQYCVPSSRDAS